MLQGEVVESLAFEVQREKILAAHDSGSAAKKSWGRGARWAVKHQPQLLKDTQPPRLRRFYFLLVQNTPP